jgi:hypothetical protein
MRIVLIVTIGLLLLLVVVAGLGLIVYYKLARHNLKPLSNAQLHTCRQVIGAGRAFPWVCRNAARTGWCAFYPCSRLRGTGYRKR